mmetsp:Transcript_2765/g.11485  ORF Transcript_2765/g.11485 Transcript_2765/m.11485 type:complete len:358 (+) Transcript_2765:1505-2578(+)
MSSSSLSSSALSFQNAAAKFAVSPMAYGAISSPSFSTIVSSVNTMSSLSTSFINLKNSSRSCGKIGRSCEMSSAASTKEASETTASTFTGSSVSFNALTTWPNRLWKAFLSVKSISANTPAHHAALARTCPCGLANAGSTCCTSMGSSCSLYPGVLLSFSCRLPIQCSAPPSSACGCSCGGNKRTALSWHLFRICTKKPITTGRFSLARFEQSSMRKFTAAVLGEYMSSMMSYPLRMNSCGSFSHSSWSSALWHTSGNTMENNTLCMCGLSCLYVDAELTAVVRYCSAKFTTRSGTNAFFETALSKPSVVSKNAPAHSLLNAVAKSLYSGLHILGLPYRLNMRLAMCRLHFLAFHQG